MLNAAKLYTGMSPRLGESGCAFKRLHMSQLSSNGETTKQRFLDKENSKLKTYSKIALSQTIKKTDVRKT